MPGGRTTRCRGRAHDGLLTRFQQQLPYGTSYSISVNLQRQGSMVNKGVNGGYLSATSWRCRSGKKAAPGGC
jgi:hypothetical protein